MDNQEEWYIRLKKEGIVKIKSEEQSARIFDEKILTEEFDKLPMVVDLLHELTRFEMIGFYEDTRSKKASDFRTHNSELPEDLLEYYKEKNGLRASEIGAIFRILDALITLKRTTPAKINITDLVNTLRKEYQGEDQPTQNRQYSVEGPNHYNKLTFMEKVEIATECQRLVGVFLDQFSVKVPIVEIKDHKPYLKLKEVLEKIEYILLQIRKQF